MDTKFNIKFLKKRVLIFSIALIVLFAALVGRLLYVQVFQGGLLQAKATDQWTRDLPVVAERGTIYDRNGAFRCKLPISKIGIGL